MTYNTPKKSDIPDKLTWLLTAPTQRERVEFKLACLDVLSFAKIPIEKLPDAQTLTKMIIPFLDSKKKYLQHMKPAELLVTC